MCRPVLTALVLAVAPSLAEAGSDPYERFADGASSVTVEGSGEVPLLRGVDTSYLPAVLGEGPDVEKEGDEFLLSLRMTQGANQCTRPVVNALGGTIEEVVLGRQPSGKTFKAATKATTELAVVPQLRLAGEDGSQILIKDWTCQVNASENTLAVPTLSEVAVAALADKGIVAFADASTADKLLARVGTPIEGMRVKGTASFIEGSLSTNVTTSILIPGRFGETEGLLGLEAGQTYVYDQAVEVEGARRRSGVLHVAGTVTVGDVVVRERAEAQVWDTTQTVWGETPEQDEKVAIGVGITDLFDVSIAVDPSTGRVALAKVDEASWTDPTQRFLDEARKAFEGDDAKDATALLQPVDASRLFADATLAEPAPTCEPELVVIDRAGQTSRTGVRALGVAGQQLQEIGCEDPLLSRAERRELRQLVRVERQEEDASAEQGTSEGDSDAGSADGDAEHSAGELADYADVLWKHGRYDEALELYAEALPLSDDDCSFYEDYALKALSMGRADAALDAARTAAELYEPWAALTVEERIDIEAGRAEGKPQPHTCHIARGIEAMAQLTRGSHREVESLFDEHMDLDEELAHALVLSRLQRGQNERARGPALQALDVGGRGSVSSHLVHGVAASRQGSDRLRQANVDRLFSLMGTFSTGTQLATAAMAREGGKAEVASFIETLVEERPGAASSWTVAALEARRMGEDGLYAELTKDADAIARDEIERYAGSAYGWCEAASLLYVAGDTAGGDAAMKSAEGKPRPQDACLVAPIVKAVVAGDAQATANGLQRLAEHRPNHPLGTLSLVQPLPGKVASSDSE